MPRAVPDEEKLPRYQAFWRRESVDRCFWAPGATVETAEDASFLTSLDAHRRFVVPVHRRFGARFPYTIVHLHSAQLHTVENLLDLPEVAAIQVTPDAPTGRDSLASVGARSPRPRVRGEGTSCLRAAARAAAIDRRGSEC